MSAENPMTGKWAIGRACPAGAVTIGSDGQPKFTAYGIGYLSAELAKDEGMSLADAIFYVAEVSARHFAVCLEQGKTEEQAKVSADKVVESAKMRLEELYRGTHHEGGQA